MGQVVIGSCLFHLNVSGQFQVSKMAAQLSESELGLNIWLRYDVTAWGTPRITVHAGKIGKISDFILVRATRPSTVAGNSTKARPEHPPGKEQSAEGKCCQ